MLYLRPQMQILMLMVRSLPVVEVDTEWIYFPQNHKHIWSLPFWLIT